MLLMEHLKGVVINADLSTILSMGMTHNIGIVLPAVIKSNLQKENKAKQKRSVK